MAYQRGDPSWFIPHRLDFLEVAGRQPMARVVAVQPRRKNDDLAIVTIHSMPEGEEAFHAIRNVVSDFLTYERKLVFTDIQPTHLGKAHVRFKNAFDRDRLIQLGAISFGNVSLTFAEHNKGRNWRSFQFNRECWIMLLGYPPDLREDEFVVNTFSSFGRVIS